MPWRIIKTGLGGVPPGYLTPEEAQQIRDDKAREEKRKADAAARAAHIESGKHAVDMAEERLRQDRAALAKEQDKKRPSSGRIRALTANVRASEKTLDKARRRAR